MTTPKIKASIVHKCTRCILDYLENGSEEIKSDTAELDKILYEGFVFLYEKQTGLTITKREKKVEGENFIGFIDGFIPETNEIFKIEIVPSHNYKDIDRPLDKHLQQTALYANALGTNLVHFVYLNRDTGERKVYNVNFTKEYTLYKKAVLQKIKEIIELFTSGVRAKTYSSVRLEVCDENCKYANRSLYAPKKEDGTLRLDELPEETRVRLIQLVNLYNNVKKEINKKEELKDIYANQIKDIMENLHVAKIEDLVAYFQVKQLIFDKEAFKNKYPNLYEQFKKERISSYFKVRC